MRKILSVFLILALAAVQPLYAAEMEPKGTALRKLQRGVLNIALSPIEISHELHKEKKKDEYFPSWVSGLGRGIIYTAGRALSGVYDLVTAPIPVPSHYEPLIYPELVTEHLEDVK